MYDSLYALSIRLVISVPSTFLSKIWRTNLFKCWKGRGCDNWSFRQTPGKTVPRINSSVILSILWSLEVGIFTSPSSNWKTICTTIPRSSERTISTSALDTAPATNQHFCENFLSLLFRRNVCLPFVQSLSGWR